MQLCATVWVVPSYSANASIIRSIISLNQWHTFPQVDCYRFIILSYWAVSVSAVLRSGRVSVEKMSTLFRVAAVRSTTISWSCWSWSTRVRLRPRPGLQLSFPASPMQGRTRRTRWGWGEQLAYSLLTYTLTASPLVDPCGLLFFCDVTVRPLATYRHGCVFGSSLFMLLVMLLCCKCVFSL